jgi:hypothetical protein
LAGSALSGWQIDRGELCLSHLSRRPASHGAIGIHFHAPIDTDNNGGQGRSDGKPITRTPGFVSHFIHTQNNSFSRQITVDDLAALFQRWALDLWPWTLDFGPWTLDLGLDRH